ncbi:MAG: CpaF family protein, partial [Nostocoides sp.]
AVLENDGSRRVREIAAVPGRIEGDVVEIADLFVTTGERLVRGNGYPPHEDRFRRFGYDLAALLAGGDE